MNSFAPAASLGTMSNNLPASNRGIIAITKTTSATTAIAVIASVRRSASPTPYRWMPMKIT
jgi:hypothetical protein